MRVQFRIIPHILKFRFEAGTSRGSFTEKETWFIQAFRNGDDSIYGLGEASPLKGLSIDYSENYSNNLHSFLNNVESLEIPEEAEAILTFVQGHISPEFPSIRFGLETALLDLLNAGERRIFDNSFYTGARRIPINGLVWMGDKAFMARQIENKLKLGFDTIKMKVGAINFEEEFALLASIRERYSASDITLRVDANGAFDQSNVYQRLEELASLEIHSIEQPVKLGQHELMHELCQSEILPIALDEELIGINAIEDKKRLLDIIKPQYIILKPSLIGGMLSTKEWIEIAESQNIGWWMTSMLESNVGLNAIAQFTAQYEKLLPQGLGTGQLYHNNIVSPLEIRKGELLYNSTKPWDFQEILSA